MTTTTISIAQLREEHEALTEVYAVAARLRQFPVPFDDHFALVGAVDQCRSVLEAVDDDPRASMLDRAPATATAWQKHVASYPREEFLETFREAHAALHKLWTEAANNKESYDKAAWNTIGNALARFARDAAGAVGIKGTEKLL